MKLLSIGGYTLGGIFCIEYQDSPIGPYREVAILSSLVGKLSWPPAIGAWASHIFVDSADAAFYGQQFWGLPASVMPIHMLENDEQQWEEKASSEPTIFFSDKEIQIAGWKAGKKAPKNEDTLQLLNLFNLSLPSFSGMLPANGTDSSDNSNDANSQTTPLLQYPLSIMQPASIGVAPSKSISFQIDVKINHPMHGVEDLLVASRPLVAVGIEKMNLVAGIPVVI